MSHKAVFLRLLRAQLLGLMGCLGCFAWGQGQPAVLGPDASKVVRIVVPFAPGGGGDGVDASFEVVGAAAPTELAIMSVRKGGTVVLVGNLQPTVPVPLQQIVTRQITLRGSCACAGEYPEAIERIRTATTRNARRRLVPRLVGAEAAL